MNYRGRTYELFGRLNLSDFIPRIKVQGP
jgi:hypothetical protein